MNVKKELAKEQVLKSKNGVMTIRLNDGVMVFQTQSLADHHG